MPERKGPYNVFPHGQYKGLTIEQLMRKDPHFFMVQVKRWMNITQQQADYFSELFDGAEIPSNYVVEDNNTVGDKTFEEVLQEQYYDFDNECWQKRENIFTASAF